MVFHKRIGHRGGTSPSRKAEGAAAASPAGAGGTLGATMLAAAGLLAGCAVGPDYKRPALPAPARLTEAPLPADTGGAAARGGKDQHFVQADVPGDWWALFHAPAITSLVREALRHNPSLKSTEAALRAAQENTLQQEGGWFPSLSGQFSRTRQELGFGAEGLSSNFAPGLPLTYSLYQAQLNVSYTFDVWGQNARTVESDAAAAEAQRWQLEGAVNMLAANTVTAAINAASLAEQITAEEGLIGAEKQVLQTVRAQFELGAATGADVAQQESQLGQTEALVAPLRTQLAQTRDQLAAYTGYAPAAAALPALSLQALTLPDALPVSVPAQLLDQRPDIRAAEAQLHEATANVGVAIANRLPQFTLQGYIGSAPAKVENLFTPGNGELYLLTQVLAPIFTGGTLLHRQRQAAALVRQALYTYENTVVTAYQNVADALVALQGDAAALQANVLAERAAERSFSLAQVQYKAGGAAYLTVLTAQTLYQNALIGLIKAEAARYTDTAALFVALGGGWWHRADLPKPPEPLLRSLLP